MGARLYISTIISVMAFKSGQLVHAFFTEPSKKAYKNSELYKKVEQIKWEGHHQDAVNLISDFKNVSKDLNKSVKAYLEIDA